MTAKILNFTARGISYQLEILTEDRQDIDAILDELNLSKSSITSRSIDFKNPITIEITNKHQQLIAKLTHEKV